MDERRAVRWPGGEGEVGRGLGRGRAERAKRGSVGGEDVCQFDFDRVMRAITVALLPLEKATVTVYGQPLALFGSTRRDRFFEHARGHAPYTLSEVAQLVADIESIQSSLATTAMVAGLRRNRVFGGHASETPCTGCGRHRETRLFMGFLSPGCWACWADTNATAAEPAAAETAVGIYMVIII